MKRYLPYVSFGIVFSGKVKSIRIGIFHEFIKFLEHYFSLHSSLLNPIEGPFMLRPLQVLSSHKHVTFDENICRNAFLVFFILFCKHISTLCTVIIVRATRMLRLESNQP